MTESARWTLKRMVEAMNRHDPVAATEAFADDVLFWEPTYDAPRRGRESVRRDLAGFFAMLPDVRFTTETLLVGGDRAVHEWSYRATYGGRPIALRECAVSHVDADGHLAEVRVYFDRLTLLRQLGLMPDVD
ncbi:MAG: ester cyclase [Thermomicrobiales bacterium]